MTSVPQVVDVLQPLLTTTADTLARAPGFTRQRSPLTGARFAHPTRTGEREEPHVTLGEHTRQRRKLRVPPDQGRKHLGK
jgi:hypothetical protein